MEDEIGHESWHFLRALHIYAISSSLNRNWSLIWIWTSWNEEVCGEEDISMQDFPVMHVMRGSHCKWLNFFFFFWCTLWLMYAMLSIRMDALPVLAKQKWYQFCILICICMKQGTSCLNGLCFWSNYSKLENNYNTVSLSSLNSRGIAAMLN